jgi:hypothetical protein
MRLFTFACLGILLCLSLGCGALAAPTAFPVPGIRQLPDDIPGCAGIKVLDEPVQFSWPSLGKNLKRVEESSWGYFHCAQSQASLSALYWDKMIEPPYGWMEITWIEQPQATLAVFFSPPTQNWLYLWFVPDPASEQSSYLVLTRGKAGFGGDWVCWLLDEQTPGTGGM